MPAPQIILARRACRHILVLRNRALCEEWRSASPERRVEIEAEQDRLIDAADPTNWRDPDPAQMY